jgi:DNA-binding transcriptional regulator YhcF (GntR family)
MIDNFKIDKNSPEPVYKQLINCFKDFIEANPEGTQLPPERELAKQLDVSRNSLRQALKYFFQNGLIVKYRGKGTFTAVQSIPKQADQYEAIHPLAQYDTAMFQEPPPIKNITLALFENMPHQKKFWQDAVKKFNDISSSAQAVIEWLPPQVSIFTKNEFDAYCHSKGITPDIIQCSMDSAITEFLMELPSDIQDFMNGKECYAESIEEGGLPLLSKIAPIYTAVPVCIWNKKIAEKFELKDIRKKIKSGKILEISKEASQKLPESMTIGCFLPNLMRFMGHPQDVENIPEKYLADFFIDLEAHYKKVKGEKEHVFPLFFKDFDLFQAFINENHLFDICLSNTSFMQLKDRIAFDCGITVFPPKESLFFSASCLAVNTNTDDPDGAFEFIRFMLSEEMQDFTTKCFYSRPYRKSSLKVLAEIFDMSAKQLDNLLSNIKIHCKINQLIWNYQVDFISYKLKELFEELTAGKISGSEAGNKAFSIWKNNINLYSQNHTNGRKQ